MSFQQFVHFLHTPERKRSRGNRTSPVYRYSPFGSSPSRLSPLKTQQQHCNGAGDENMQNIFRAPPLLRRREEPSWVLRPQLQNDTMDTNEAKAKEEASFIEVLVEEASFEILGGPHFLETMIVPENVLAAESRELNPNEQFFIIPKRKEYFPKESSYTVVQNVEPFFI